MTTSQQEKSTKTWLTRYVLEVTPKSTPRARHGRNGVYNNPAYIVYKRTLGTLMLSQRMKKGSNYTGLAVVFYIPVPHKKGKFDASLDETMSNDRKDVDNMKKALMDAMQDVGIIKNDKDIHTIIGLKKWTKNKTGRIEILPFTDELFDFEQICGFLREKTLCLESNN